MKTAQIQFEPDIDDYADGHRDMLGHPEVRILMARRSAGRSTAGRSRPRSRTVTTVAYHQVRATRDDSSRISGAEVEAGLGQPGRLLIDARDLAEFSGNG